MMGAIIGDIVGSVYEWNCGFTARTGMWPSNGRAKANLSAEVTHNHPEGIKVEISMPPPWIMTAQPVGKVQNLHITNS